MRGSSFITKVFFQSAYALNHPYYFGRERGRATPATHPLREEANPYKKKGSACDGATARCGRIRANRRHCAEKRAGQAGTENQQAPICLRRLRVFKNLFVAASIWRTWLGRKAVCDFTTNARTNCFVYIFVLLTEPRLAQRRGSFYLLCPRAWSGSVT